MKNKVDSVFTLMIFCVFALSVFLVLMFGGSAYGNMTRISEDGRNERVVLSYIRTKIRSADNAGSVFVGYFHGIPALLLEESFDGRDFVTYIYYYDGWARELFHERNQGFLPEDGVPIVRAGSLGFEMTESGLIRVSTDYGNMLISPRSMESEGIR